VLPEGQLALNHSFCLLHPAGLAGGHYVHQHAGFDVVSLGMFG